MLLNVEEIYCINLDYCTDRWNRMSRRLTGITPKMKRIEAISTLDSRVFQQKKIGNPLSLGAIGCALSHLDLWKRIVEKEREDETKEKLYLILEDDVYFLKDWVQVVNNDLHFLSKKIGVDRPLYYQLNGCGFISFDKDENASTEMDGLFSISQEKGILYYTGAYIVNIAACKELVQQFDIQKHQDVPKFLIPSDHMTKWLQQSFGGTFENSHCFFHYPWISIQECLDTHVQSETHLASMKDFNNNVLLPYFPDLYPETSEKFQEIPEPKEKKEKKSITLVTMFYDLGTIKDNPSRRQKEDYLKFGDFILGLEYDMVIFTESSSEEHMWKRRLELLGNTEKPKTLIVSRKFEKLPYLCDETLRKRANENWKVNTPVFPDKLTADYSLMCCGRPALVAEVAEWNPFQTTHFGWVDFGCDHISNLKENFQSATANGQTFFLPDTDRLYIPQKKEMTKENFDLKFASKNLLDQVLGTYFCGSKRAVLKYADLFGHALKDAVFKQGLCPADEPLSTWLNILIPGFLQCYLTDWSYLLSAATVNLEQNFKHTVRTLYDAEKHWKILDLIDNHHGDKGKFGDENLFSTIEWHVNFVEAFVFVFYQDQPDQTRCTEIARKHVNWIVNATTIDEESEVVKLYWEKEELILENFSCLLDKSVFEPLKGIRRPPSLNCE